MILAAIDRNDPRARIAMIVASAAIGVILAATAPTILLIGVIASVTALGAWLVFELALAAKPLVWSDYRQGARSPQHDRGFQIMRARIGAARRVRRSPVTLGNADLEPAGVVADTLLDLIDDHLASEHGVLRAVDPSAAAAILGPELARFAADPAARRSMTRRRALPSTLALIEALDAPASQPSPRATTP